MWHQLRLPTLLLAVLASTVLAAEPATQPSAAAPATPAPPHWWEIPINQLSLYNRTIAADKFCAKIVATTKDGRYAITKYQKFYDSNEAKLYAHTSQFNGYDVTIVPIAKPLTCYMFKCVSNPSGALFIQNFFAPSLKEAEQIFAREMNPQYLKDHIAMGYKTVEVYARPDDGSVPTKRADSFDLATLLHPLTSPKNK